MVVSRCYQMAKIAWTKRGLTRKDISVVPCVGSWFVEYKDIKKEVSAHCKWCAVFEAL